jgi:hypothetical protein
MPVNRRELLNKVDEMIEAEQAAQPLGLVGSLVQDLETISEEETPFQSLPLDLLNTASSAFSLPSE